MMNEALKEYGLHIEHSEAEDREPIDFEIRDEHGELCATVWGSEPWKDVQIDCSHPAVEFGDDEHVGECPICGAWAYWHYESYGDDGYIAKDRVIDRWEQPDQWEQPSKIGGVVGEYLKELQERW